MMVADDIPGLAHGPERRAQACANFRMLPHESPLIRIKCALLEQDAVGYSQFTDVMQDAAAPQGIQVIIIQPQLLPEHHRHVRQPVAVIPGCFVLGLHHARQGKQHRFGVVQAVGSAFLFRRCSHLGRQFDGIE